MIGISPASHALNSATALIVAVAFKDAERVAPAGGPAHEDRVRRFTPPFSPRPPLDAARAGHSCRLRFVEQAEQAELVRHGLLLTAGGLPRHRVSTRQERTNESI